MLVQCTFKKVILSLLQRSYTHVTGMHGHVPSYYFTREMLTWRFINTYKKKISKRNISTKLTLILIYMCSFTIVFELSLKFKTFFQHRTQKTKLR